MPAVRVPEVVLSRIWNDGWHSRELRTTDGRRVGVVYRGVWTHSDGPDFRDAMLDVDGRLIQGSVELHVRSSDWFVHRHHENPEYDGVILHVVLENDAGKTAHGPSGNEIATVSLREYLHGPVEHFMEVSAPVTLGNVGASTCLPTLAGGRGDLIRRALRREGWRRMQEKQLRFLQELEARPPGEVLYRALLDSLGLSANREGMERVAEAVPLQLLEPVSRERGLRGVAAALLGTAGFLPLSAGHASLIGEPLDALEIERQWAHLVGDLGLAQLPATIWNLKRVRPLNHPVRRLASMASLVHRCSRDGLFATVMGLPLDGGTAWDAWLAGADPPIGASRRTQIVVNAIAPYRAAHAERTGDEEDVEAISDTWERIAGRTDDEIARKTLRQIVGGQRMPIRTALEVQGLHQIGRHGCAHLRCFECPIAGLAVRYEGYETSDRASD